jgi:hypothetical protein
MQVLDLQVEVDDDTDVGAFRLGLLLLGQDGRLGRFSMARDLVLDGAGDRARKALGYAEVVAEGAGEEVGRDEGLGGVPDEAVPYPMRLCVELDLDGDRSRLSLALPL